MTRAAEILFFKATQTTQSICLIPIMETNKRPMSETLRDFHHRTRHWKVLDLCDVSVSEAHIVNLWPCIHWGQPITTYALYPYELHSAKDVLTCSVDSAVTQGLFGLSKLNYVLKERIDFGKWSRVHLKTGGCNLGLKVTLTLGNPGRAMQGQT